MALDFTEFFERYEKIVSDVETVFNHVKDKHSDCVTCKPGCSDCCYALFDLSLIEAMYLNHHLNKRYKGAERAVILDRADKADREAYKHKREVYKASQAGKPAKEILDMVAEMRIRCPLLNDKDECDLYENRPFTCRLYGIPTNIHGEAHTCGKSKFVPGEAYPTANVDSVMDSLIALSQELVEGLPTKHTEMADILVPVSMALMNNYDDKYLGIQEDPDLPEGMPQAVDFSSGGTLVLGEKGGVKFEATCSGCAKKDDCPSQGDPSGCSEGPQG